MGNTSIEWTGKSWNVLRGCTKVSEGCTRCYAEKMAARFNRGKTLKEDYVQPALPYHGVIEKGKWNGKIRFVDHLLEKPLSWKKPTKIFVNSMSDLFHKNVEEEWIDKIFAVMALAPRHTFQILTKRPERMLNYFQGDPYERILRQADKIRMRRNISGVGISDPNIRPMPNVHMGVSVESQDHSDRIDLLLQVPATVRWISYEPALGPLDLKGRLANHEWKGGIPGGINWVVCGGESGPGARPMHPDWARSVRDQCKEAEVPFLFKQYGAWRYIICVEHARNLKGLKYFKDMNATFLKVGKKKAGRILDGELHDEYPESK